MRLLNTLYLSTKVCSALESSGFVKGHSTDDKYRAYQLVKGNTQIDIWVEYWNELEAMIKIEVKSEVILSSLRRLLTDLR
jgi:hypothetical protein